MPSALLVAMRGPAATQGVSWKLRKPSKSGKITSHRAWKEGLISSSTNKHCRRIFEAADKGKHEIDATTLRSGSQLDLPAGPAWCDMNDDEFESAWPPLSGKVVARHGDMNPEAAVFKPTLALDSLIPAPDFFLAPSLY